MHWISQKMVFKVYALFFLLHPDFSNFCNSFDVDHHWSFFIQLHLDSLTLFVSKVKISCKNFPKWFAPQIKHSINQLRCHRGRFKKNPTDLSWNSILKSGKNIPSQIMGAKFPGNASLVSDQDDKSNHKTYK